MATTIKRISSTAQRLVVAFDGPPTVKEMLDALKNIDPADRTAFLKTARSDTSSTDGPKRFIFVVEGESEVDVPVA